MAIPAARILEAARIAWSRTEPLSNDMMRDKFEWVWGLERGTFDEHVSSYPDPKLVDVLLDDNLILISHPDLIGRIFLLAASLSWRFSSKKRVLIQKIYEGREIFEYLVLPVDPSSGVLPRTIFSCVPPHLTISDTADKIMKRGDYAQSLFTDIAVSLVTLVRQTPAPGATFVPDADDFSDLRFIHQRWAIAIVPRRFLGLEGSQFEASDEEESDENMGSSTMEWEAPTLPDEPQRHLFPHDLKQDPVFKFWTPAADDEDDVISRDSHITGVEEPEEFVKASLARGLYSPDRVWMDGVKSWVESASGAGDQGLVNDAQIEDDEQPRTVNSLDLETPDYYRLCKIPKRA